MGWGGMSHTGSVAGFGSTPQWGIGGMQQNPLAQHPYFSQGYGVNPFLQGGFSHSGSESVQDPRTQLYMQWLLQQQAAVDPYYGMRVSQTFPFAQIG
jgi:hypothetical protein